ncbi:MAG: type VI secretion system baseplate subunit TssF [Gemmataceae bacterium]
MSQNIEQIYERELAFLSSPQDGLASYFARKYPREAGFAAYFERQFPADAGHLTLDPGQALDPHGERITQAFALLTGRIHHRLDHEFQHLQEALLGILYPHVLRPIPSMAMAQFIAEPGRSAGQKLSIPRGTQLVSRLVGQPARRCSWRTGYPVDLWPLRITEAKIQRSVAGSPPVPDSLATLRMRITCDSGSSFANMPLETLRLCLQVDGEAAANLYELLFNGTIRVLVRDPSNESQDVLLEPEEIVSPVGFEPEEELLPFPVESFVGYRLLTEFFCFPKKFHFVDLKLQDPLARGRLGTQLEVVFFLNQLYEELARVVNERTFQLGCTPVINLFSQGAEPIALTHTKHEYSVVVDRESPENAEVYSVDAVGTFEPNQEVGKEYLPFYSFREGENRNNRRALWYASRRSETSREEQQQSEVSLVLVDQDFNPHQPAKESVTVQTTCTNRNLPAYALRGGDRLVLSGDDLAFRGSVHLLTAPTLSRSPALLTRKASLWQLLSQTALNHVPLSNETEGIHALKETLLLCARLDLDSNTQRHDAVAKQIIDGITAFQGRPVVHSVWDGKRVGRCRGIEFTLELDVQKYVGTGAFFFASVLERFLGLYASANSFSQLQVRHSREEGYIRKWNPRAAQKRLP